MAKRPQKKPIAPGKPDTPFRRFERLAQKIVSVPKRQIEPAKKQRSE
jgi:hypothetical protein